MQTANCDYPAQNLRDLSDYTITGDSAAGWSIIGHWVGNNTYTAANFGFTQPTWAWMPGGSTLAGTGSADTQAKHFAFDFGTDTTTVLSQTTTTTCNVTDSDGTNASNTYTVNWHYPYEKTSDISSTPVKDVQQTLIGPVHAGDPAVDIPEAEGGDIDIAAGIDGIAAGVGLSGQEEAAGILELLAAGAGLADLKFHYGGESAHARAADNGQDKWDATRSRSEWAENVSDPSLLSLRDPDTGQFAGWRFCDMSICLVKRSHHKTWYADNYGGNGFVSSQNIMFADPVDKIDEEPFYTTVSNPPSSWTP